MPRTSRRQHLRLHLLSITAGLTSFYSWRLFFLTFMGTARWDTPHGHDPMFTTTSPRTPPTVRMLTPRLCMTTMPTRRRIMATAMGARAARVAAHDADPARRARCRSAVRRPVFENAFFGHACEDFWKGAIFAAENHILRGDPPFPAGCVVAHHRDGHRLRGGLALLHQGAASAARNWPTSQPGLYRFLLNKWYFDELYDIIFVRTAKWLGRFLWKKGDGMVIDGLGP